LLWFYSTLQWVIEMGHCAWKQLTSKALRSSTKYAITVTMTIVAQMVDFNEFPLHRERLKTITGRNIEAYITRSAEKTICCKTQNVHNKQ